MRLEIVFMLFVLSSFKEISKVLVNAKSIQSELETTESCRELNTTNDFALAEGRKKKKPNNGGSNVIIVENDHDLDDHYEHDVHYVEVEESHMKRGKGKKGKGKRKKLKGSKKIFKKMQPVIIGLGGLKLVLYHLFLKKMALTTALSFILSKVSFVLATLVALKQFFHTPTHHRSSDSSKLEVVHIPIKKFHGHHRDKDYDESQFIPVTFPPEADFNTTPFYYDFPYSEHNSGTFFSNEELKGSSDGKLNNEFGTFGFEKFGENFDGKFSENFNGNGGKFKEVFNNKFVPVDGKLSDSFTVEYPPKLNGKFSDSGGFLKDNSDLQFSSEFDTKFSSNFNSKFNEDFGGKFNENFDAKFNNNFKPQLSGKAKPIFGEKINQSFDGKLLKSFDGKFKDSLKPKLNKNENESFTDIYNEHFQSKLSAADKSDDDEKTFYKSHVHSPFV